MKQAILSFDYELFFGDNSGTVQKTYMEPTNIMLDALDTINAKATFFVDYLMLKYLKKENCQRTLADLLSIEKQLMDIVRRGHRIELHIHSHWVDAKYKGDGTWDFSDFTHYGLTSFSKEQVEQIFVEGVESLTTICKEVVPSYKIIAFRAGGWVIRPFDIFFDAFKKVGIIVDSSVALGVKINMDYSNLDFTDIPYKSFYLFDDKLEVERENGAFWEFPITSYPYTIWNRIRNRLYREIHKDQFKIFADGSHFRVTEKGKMSFDIIQFSLARISPHILLNKIKKTPLNLIVFIDHPKDFAPINVENLKRIASLFDFVTYLDIIKNRTNR